MKQAILFFITLFPAFLLAQNIGVGTNEPNAKMHVSGYIKTDSSLIIDTVAFNAADMIMIPNQSGFVVINSQMGRQMNRIMLSGQERVGQILFLCNHDDDSLSFNVHYVKPQTTAMFISSGQGWERISSKEDIKELSDFDGDTKIEVEKNHDEDKIRFTLEGDEAVVFEKTIYGNNRLVFPSNYSNILVGVNAGDSLTTGYRGVSFHNLAIGNNSLAKNNGTCNVSLGNNTLRENIFGEDNTAIGFGAGGNSQGSSNTFLGKHSGWNLEGYRNVSIGSLNFSGINYGSFNTSIGYAAGFNLDKAYSNIFLGYRVASNSDSLNSSTIIGSNAGNNANGKYHVFIGDSAGINNRWSETGNIFIGRKSGVANTSGEFNTYLGNLAGHTSNGSGNSFLGYSAGSNAIGSFNTLLGAQAGLNVSGNGNTIIGNNAGADMNGSANIILGEMAAYSSKRTTSSLFIGNKTGFEAENTLNSIFIGNESGFSSSARYSTHIGYKSGYLSSGTNNIFMGTQSGENNTTASNNIALGYRSAYSNETGGSNITLGTDALFRNLTGSRNIAIGDSAGFNNRSGVGKNIFIGHGAGKNELGKNKLIIENSDSRKPLIFGDFENDYVTVGGNLNAQTISPIINNTYDLGSSVYKWRAVYALNGTIQTSDIRQKKNIQNLNYGLNEVMKMRSVSYEWKHDTIGETKVGFIAQELEQIIPEVVVVGNDSLQTRGVNYAELIPVLVNAIKEQQALINKLEVDNTAKDHELQLVNNRMSSLENKLDLLLGSMVKQ